MSDKKIDSKGDLILDATDDVTIKGNVIQNNKWQRKELTADITASNTDFLDFNGLTVGKNYRYTGNVYLVINGSANFITVYLREGTTNIGQISLNASPTSDTVAGSYPFSHIFTATATSVKLRTWTSMQAGSTVKEYSSGTTLRSTWGMIEELNDYDTETTDFT